MTVKGLNCLRQADVVIYDRLVDESILGEVRSDAEKIYVGKSSDHHTLEQSEINRLLIDKGQERKQASAQGDPLSSDGGGGGGGLGPR
jgi:siroheme synthase